MKMAWTCWAIGLVFTVACCVCFWALVRGGKV